MHIFLLHVNINKSILFSYKKNKKTEEEIMFIFNDK